MTAHFTVWDQVYIVWWRPQAYCTPPHLQSLSEEGSLLSLGPLNAFKTQLNFLPCCCLHVEKEVQQRANQPGRLGLADGNQERPHKFQQTPQFCRQKDTYILAWKHKQIQVCRICCWTTSLDLFTCSLAGFGQECPQLQDALFFNPDSFFIIFLNISPHC